MNTVFSHSLIFTNLFPLAIAIYFLLLANIRKSLCNSSGVMTLNVSKKRQEVKSLQQSPAVGYWQFVKFNKSSS